MEQLTLEQRMDCARRSWQAEQDRREIEMLTLTYPGLDREEGYAVQELRNQLVEQAGHRVVGYKLGSTSLRKRQQMGTTASSYGRLYEYMAIPPGQPLELDRFIHPKVEPEITFVLGRDLCGPNITAAQVMAAAECVVCSLEVIDSRYVNFKFTGGDVVSDNISGGAYVLSGQKYDPKELDLELLGVRLAVNGVDQGYAACCEVLGHPARALAEFANIFFRRTGQPIRAGQFVMTGGITQSITLSRGDHVSARFAHMGEVTLDVI